MKKTVATIIALLIVTVTAYSQTMYSILFANMKEQGREADRTAEMENMTKFCCDIADALGYTHDLRTHSDNEFTAAMMEREIASLNVQQGDIVILYYAGHGCNWDDDDWPHMALNDRQYWQTTAYNKLKGMCGKAKLTLCIASCCNMDSEGRRRENGQYNYATINRAKVRELFTGFSGNRSIIMSSSIRGQYTYSWSSGNRLGSIFSISLRDEIYDAVMGVKSTPLTWEAIKEATIRQTLAYTKGKQRPQMIIENNNNSTVSNSQRQTPTTLTPKAEILSTWLEHNVTINDRTYMAIHFKMKTHFMNDYGGMAVAFIHSPKGVYVKDTNGLYRTTDGSVCTYDNFGSHYEHSIFNDYKLLIPVDEIHLKRGRNTYYVIVYIFDNKTQKYIANGEHVTFIGTN